MTVGRAVEYWMTRFRVTFPGHKHRPLNYSSFSSALCSSPAVLLSVIVFAPLAHVSLIFHFKFIHPGTVVVSIFESLNIIFIKHWKYSGCYYYYYVFSPSPTFGFSPQARIWIVVVRSFNSQRPKAARPVRNVGYGFNI